MNIEMEFESYLDKSLQGAERVAFEKKLNADPGLKAYFDLYCKGRSYLSSQNRVAQTVNRLVENPSMAGTAIPLSEAGKEAEKYLANEKLNNLEQEFLNALKAGKQSNRNKKRIIWTGSVAAGFLLLVGLFLFTGLHRNSKSTERLFARYYSPYPCIMQVRGAANREYFEMKNAMTYYNNKDYHDAAALLTRTIADSANHPLESLYLGVCYIELNDYDKAIQVLEPIAGMPDGITSNQANWYLGLTFLKMHNISRAKIYFGKVTSDSCSYSTKATDIIKKLN